MASANMGATDRYLILLQPSPVEVGMVFSRATSLMTLQACRYWQIITPNAVEGAPAAGAISHAALLAARAAAESPVAEGEWPARQHFDEVAF